MRETSPRTDFPHLEGAPEAVWENAGLTGELTAGGLLNRLPATLADG